MKKLILKYSPVDKLIIQFENAYEWQDLVAAINRFQKIIKSEDPANLPHRLVLGRWLTNCFSSTLPSGLHLKALEIVEIILTCEQPPADLADNFTTFGVGLCRLYSKATLNVKMKILDLFDLIIDKMARHSEMRPTLEITLAALLTDLDEYSQEYEATTKAIKSCLRSVGRDYFYAQLWRVIGSFSDTRLAGLRLVIDSLRVPDFDVSPLAVESLVGCLVSPDVGVRRICLDLLNIYLPLDSLIENYPEMSESLLQAAFLNLCSRDSQLLRRLSRWIVDPLNDPNFESSVYLIFALKSVFSVDCSALTKDCEDLRSVCPMRVVTRLCERCSYFRRSDTVDLIFPTILDHLCAYKFAGDSEEAKLFRQFGELVNISFIWRYFMRTVSLKSAQSLEMLEFVLPLLHFDFYEKRHPSALSVVIELFGCLTKIICSSRRVDLITLIDSLFSMIAQLMQTEDHLHRLGRCSMLLRLKANQQECPGWAPNFIRLFVDAIPSRLCYNDRLFIDDSAVLLKDNIVHLTQNIIQIWGLLLQLSPDPSLLKDTPQFPLFCLHPSVLHVALMFFGCNRVASSILRILLSSPASPSTHSVIMDFMITLKTPKCLPTESFSLSLLSREITRSPLLQDIIETFWRKNEQNPLLFLRLAYCPLLTSHVVKFLLAKMSGGCVRERVDTVGGMGNVVTLLTEQCVGRDQRDHFPVVFGRILIVLVDQLVKSPECQLRQAISNLFGRIIRRGHTELIGPLFSPLLFIDTERSLNISAFCDIEGQDVSFTIASGIVEEILERVLGGSGSRCVRHYRICYDHSRVLTAIERLRTFLGSLGGGVILRLYSSPFRSDEDCFARLGMSDLRLRTVSEALVELLLCYICSYHENDEGRVDNQRVQLAASVALKEVVLSIGAAVEGGQASQDFVTDTGCWMFSTLLVDVEVAARILSPETGGYPFLQSAQLELYEGVIRLRSVLAKHSPSSNNSFLSPVVCERSVLDFARQFESLESGDPDLVDSWMHFLVFLTSHHLANSSISSSVIAVICRRVTVLCQPKLSPLNSLHYALIRSLLEYLHIFCRQTLYLDDTCFQCFSGERPATPSWDKFVTIMNPANWIYRSKKSFSELGFCPHLSAKVQAVGQLPSILECCCSVIALPLDSREDDDFYNVKEAADSLFVDIFRHVGLEVVTATMVTSREHSFLELYLFPSSIPTKVGLVVEALAGFVRDQVLAPGGAVDVETMVACLDFISRFLSRVSDAVLMTYLDQIADFLRLFSTSDWYSATSSPVSPMILKFIFELHGLFSSLIGRVMTDVVDKRIICRFQDFYQRSLYKSLTSVLTATCLRLTNYMFKTHNLVKPEEFADSDHCLSSISVCESVLQMMNREVIVILDCLFLANNVDRAVQITTDLLTFVVPFIYSPSEYESCRISAAVFLSLLCVFQPLKRSWKKRITSLFMDPSFATLGEPAMSYFLPIIDNLILNDNSVIRDLIDRALPWGYQNTVNLFVNHEIDSKSAANAVHTLFRISFVLLSAETNQFSCFIPELQKRLHEVFAITSGPRNQVHSAAFFLIRALFFRVSHTYMSSIWNLALFEVKKVIMGITIHDDPSMKTPADRLDLALSACKLLDLMLTLPESHCPGFQFRHMFTCGNYPADCLLPLKLDEGNRRPLLRIQRIERMCEMAEFFNVLGGSAPRKGQTYWQFPPLSSYPLDEVFIILRNDLLSFQF